MTAYSYLNMLFYNNKKSLSTENLYFFGAGQAFVCYIYPLTKNTCHFENGK